MIRLFCVLFYSCVLCVYVCVDVLCLAIYSVHMSHLYVCDLNRNVYRIRIYMYIHIHISYVRVIVCACMYMYIYMYMNMNMYVNVYRICIYVYMYLYICMIACVCMYMYMYMNINVSASVWTSNINIYIGRIILSVKSYVSLHIYEYVQFQGEFERLRDLEDMAEGQKNSAILIYPGRTTVRSGIQGTFTILYNIYICMYTVVYI